VEAFTRDGIKFTRIHESDAGFMFQFEVYRREKFLVFQKRLSYGNLLIPNKTATWNFTFNRYEDAIRKFRALKKAKKVL
jgi:hypothetical protein